MTREEMLADALAARPSHRHQSRKQVARDLARAYNVRELLQAATYASEIDAWDADTAIACLRNMLDEITIESV